MAFIPNDPRFSLQWHLLNDDPTELDLNVVDAWDDYDGSGVEVVAIDRGFDYFHLDYDNYRTDLDWDFEDIDDNVALPDPNENDRHGTPVLGIIGAAQDGQGTVGIAFGADIIGYKTDWSRDEVAAGIDRAVANNHDVVNMSYGEFDGNGADGNEEFRQREELIDSVNAALQDGRTVNGTDLGTILVKSAGNSRGDLAAPDREETTAEAMDSHRGTITVAGVRADGEVNGASSPGASVLVSAFYGGVQTTDISGAPGYNNGNFVNFNGTSAAAPQVAGVVALMLEANPNLGWRDVQTILSYTARHVGSDVGAAAQGNEQATHGNATWRWNSADNWNGGGMHISNDYGFGLVDAEAAVRLAETWTFSRHSGNDAFTTQDALNREVRIAEGSSTGGTEQFLAIEQTNIEIEHVTLSINFTRLDDTHDLEVYLTSPEGTRIQMIRQTGDFDSFDGLWRFGATGFRGEGSGGLWRVEVVDKDSANSSAIEIDDIRIRTWGALDSDDDLFIFTNEYSDYAGIAGHSTNIAGGAGNDTVNTAAVDTGVTINLQNGSGIIDGQIVSLSSIETVYTGVHQDIVFDGAGNNEIHSGRGNDIVRDTSAGGSDIYWLGQGDDTMQVRSAIGSDTFRGGSGSDTISWTTVNETGATFDLAAGTATDANGNSEIMRSFENIVGTANRDTIIESGAANDIDGYEGNDTVIVTTVIGADSFDGGLGRDMIDWSAVNETGATFDLAAGTATDANGNVEVMANFEEICGTENADTIIENGAINMIDAKGGNDTVIVTTVIGSDSFNGGFGTDTIDWSGSGQVNGVYDLTTGTASAGGSVETMFGFENFIGTNQADTIIEGNGPNVINARSGDDLVRVTTVIGVDSFTGGFGTDTIDWSDSAQANGVYDLGAGTATAGGSVETMFGFENFIGTNQADTIVEGNGPNVIDGRSGDDLVQVTTTIGVDSFTGGFGTDTIDWSGSSQVGGVYDLGGGTATSGGSTETMFGFENFIGTNQADTIIEGNGANEINAGSGDDLVQVTTGIGVDSFTGGFGNDTIDWSGSSQANGVYDLSGGTASAGGSTETMFGFENFIGSAQRDTLIEGAGTNVIDLGDGNDLLRVGTGIGADSYEGGAGIDLADWSDVSEIGARFDLQAGWARDADGNEEVMTGFENLYGTDNGDRIWGTGGDNLLRGFDGVDRISGRAGEDLIAGGGARDILRGNGGSDLLQGDAGNDVLRGGNGADRLIDGTGRDRLIGGNGADVFEFVLNDDDRDRIADFQDGTDLIALNGLSFGQLTIEDQGNGNVRIRYGVDQVLILEDEDDQLAAADLTAADFIF